MIMIPLYSIYFLTLALLFYMVYLLLQRSSRAAAALLCCDLSLAILIFGMLLEVMMASSVEAALVCLKLQYVGQAIFLMSLMYFFSIYLHVRVHAWVYLAQLAINGVVLAACLTAESHPYFYSSMKIVRDGAYPMILVTDGPVWYLHYAHMFLVLFGIMGAAIFRYKRASERQKMRCFYLLAGLGVMTVELLLKGAGLFGTFNPFVFAAFFYAACLYWGVIRYGYFDTVEAAMSNVLDLSEEGFLVADGKECVLYMNAQMGRMFPTMRVGGPVRCAELIDEIFNGRREILQDGFHYRAILQEVGEGELHDGKMLRLIDMTEYHEQMERLRRENERKTDFLSRVSHEIRTPLNTINGMNEMILRECRDPQIGAYARDAREAGRMLMALIGDMLDVTRMENAEMELEPGRFEAGRFFRRLWRAEKLKCDKKGLELKFRVDPALPAVWDADETRLYQIVENLLSNAVKYTEAGSVTLTAGRSGAGLSFAVRDTGIGIPAESLDKIFHRFEQLETGHKRQGLGLGLDIVRGLVEMMGGQVSVTSEVGKGSVFTVTVPVPLDETAGTVGADWLAEGEDEETDRRLSYRCDGKRILVVDDNEMNRRVIRNFLKDSGITVDEAASGAACLEIFPQGRYDLLLLDHMMPDMDGVLLFHRLTGLPAYREAPVPVIAMTANALKGARQMFLAEGFDDYLAKPVDAESLFDMLQEYLGGVLESVTREEEDGGGKDTKMAGAQEAAEMSETAGIQEEAETPETVWRPEEAETQERIGTPETIAISETTAGTPVAVRTQKTAGTPETAGMLGAVGAQETDSMVSGEMRKEKGCSWADFSWISGLGADLEQAKRYADGSAEFFREELEIFKRNAPEALRGLERDWEQSDNRAARIRVHALKNNLATLGFSALSEQARRLEERLAEGGREETGQEKVERENLEREVQDFVREGERMIGGLQRMK